MTNLLDGLQRVQEALDIALGWKPVGLAISQYTTNQACPVEDARELMDTLIEQAKGTEWQDISTAPKGVRVIGLTKYGVEIVWWKEGVLHEFYSCPAGWWGLEQDSECKPKQMQPTHWQPLPQPPKEG